MDERRERMIPILDFQDRSVRGPVMEADDFDLQLAFKVRELVADYGIKYDREHLVVDDRTADAIFHAAVDLLADVGLYHMGTQRVVRYACSRYPPVVWMTPFGRPVVPDV